MSDDWLGGRDSNPDNVLQRHASYRWTTSQSGIALRLGAPKLSLARERKRACPPKLARTRERRRTETLIIHVRLGTMHPAGPYLRVALGMVCVFVCSATASAQTAGYIAGTVFADIRQFGSATSQAPFLSDVSRDATGGGGGLRVGTWVHPRWTIEAGIEVASRTTAEFRGPVIAIFPPPPIVNFKSSTSFVNVSTMVGFHSPAGRRVRLGYLAGFSFIRATHTTGFPNIPLPDFRFDDRLGFDSAIAYFSSIPISRAALSLPPTTVTTRQNSGALTLGFEAAIDLKSKLAVVPEIRASTFSAAPGGASVFLIRPSVGVRWKF